jgi:hypothetical protein
MVHPIIFNGDHADWPLPSFDAHDWAAAFCKIANGFGFKDSEGKPIDEGWMISWFANALMRGYDEHAGKASGMVEALHDIAEPVQALQRMAEADGLTLDGAAAIRLANDANYLRGIARAAIA